ncbi:unnamed protein product [Oreochromis niloticus]|nr:unnamed protein product [Mustela putorius furo]
MVKLKMEKTFSYRRHEVVRDAPMVETFMARWPALFDFHEINAEFKRIATIPPQTKFLAQLDLHLGNLVKLVNRRGELGLILERIAAQMDNCEDVDAGRECVKGVCIYMGEDPDMLIREYVGMEERAINETVEDITVGIYLKEQASAEEQELFLQASGWRRIWIM